MLPNTIRARHLFAFVVIGIVTVSILITAQTPAKGPIVRFSATTDNVAGAGDAVRIELLNWSTEAERDQLVAAWTLTRAPGTAAAAGGARGGARGGGAGAGGGRGGGGARGAAPPETPAPANGDNAAAPAAAAPAPAQAAAGAAAAGGRGGGGGRGGRGGAPAAPAVAETPESSLAAALQAASTVGFIWTSESTGYSIRYAYRMPQPDGTERIILATERRLGAWSDLWKPRAPASPTNYEFTVVELRLNAKGEGEGKASLTGKVMVDSAAKTISLDGYSALPVVLKGVKRL